MTAPDDDVLALPEWGTHVLIRNAAKRTGGALLAQGVRPWAAIDPSARLPAGLDRLRAHGVTSIALVTDPLWSPEGGALEQAFTVCRPLKESFVFDSHLAPLKVRKRHRNRIHHARRVFSVQPVALSEHLDAWWEMYQRHARDDVLVDRFTRPYFCQLAQLPGLVCLAVSEQERIVGMTLWLTFGDIAYFHDAVSSERGLEGFATHLGFAQAMENFSRHRFVCLGGGGGIRDDAADGLAEFKRGFANTIRTSWFCSRIDLRG